MSMRLVHFWLALYGQRTQPHYQPSIASLEWAMQEQSLAAGYLVPKYGSICVLENGIIPLSTLHRCF
jgi:hypothetical protein